MSIDKKNFKLTNYLLYLPEDYQEEGKKFPLLFFLHGAGERGNNLDLLFKYGPARQVKEGLKLPFVIVAPQCSRGTYWSTHVLKDLLEEILNTYSIDVNRIYLTGVSMGGYGTWALAIDYPEKFAAIAPICGGGNPALVYKIKDIPTWVFHGAKDDIVPLQESVVIVEALKNVNESVKFTVYPDLKHDSWTRTYNNPELYKWFLDNKKNN